MKRFLCGYAVLALILVMIFSWIPSFRLNAAYTYSSGAVVIDGAAVEEHGTEYIIEQGVYSVTVTDGVDVTLIFNGVTIDRSTDGLGDSTTGAATAAELYEAGRRLHELTGEAAWSKTPAAGGYYVPTCPFLITGGASVTARFDGDCLFRAGGNGWYLASQTGTLENALASDGRGGYAGIQVDGDASLTIAGANNLKAYGAFPLAGTASSEGQTYEDDPLKVNPVFGLDGTGSYPWDRPTAVSTTEINGGGAGIGGGASYDTETVRVEEHGYTAGTPGEIVVDSGNIYAVGGHQAAGIGGGVNSAATTSQIVINGGNITAIGGRFATGIGDGDSISEMESFLYAENYAIVINGGMVGAYGGTSAAAIGTTDNITVNDPQKTPFSKTSGLSITIAGGVVSAQSGEATGEGSATAAIGSGENTDVVDNSITIDSAAKVIAASFSQYAISGCGTDASLVPVVNIDPSGYMYLARFAASSEERIFTLYPVKTDEAGNPMLVSVKASEILGGAVPDNAVYYALDREKNEYYCVNAYGNAIGEDGAILENGERYYPAEILDISYYYNTSAVVDTVSVPGKYTAVALTLPDPAEYGGCYVVHVPDGESGTDDDIYAVLHKYQSGTTSGKIEYQGDYHVSKGTNHADRETPSVVEDPTAAPLTALKVFPIDADTGEIGADLVGNFSANIYGYTVYLPYGTTNFQLYSAYAASDDVISVSVSGSTVTSQTLHYTSNGLFMEHTLDVSVENEESVDIWIRKTDRSTGVGSDPYLVYKITVIVKKMYMIGMDPLDKLYDGIAVSALPDRVILPSGYRYDISEGEDSNTPSSVSCEGLPDTVIDTFRDSFESGSRWNGKRELGVTISVALDADSRMISINTSISNNSSAVQIVTQVSLKASSSESRITYSNVPASFDYFYIAAENGKITLVSQYNSAYSYEILNVSLSEPETENELTEEQIEANRNAVIEALKESTRSTVEKSENLTESSENGQYNKGNRTTKYTLTVEGISSSAGDTVKKEYGITDATDSPIQGNVRVIATYYAEEDITARLTETERNSVEYRYYRDVNGDGILDSGDELLSSAPKDAGKYFVTAFLTTQTYEAYGGLSFTVYRKEIEVVAVENWRTYLSPQELAAYDGVITDLGRITVSGVLPGEAVVLLTDSIVGKYVDTGGAGYTDDIGYHERKIRLSGLYLDPAEPVNANYIFSLSAVQTDGSAVFYVYGELTYKTTGAIFRKTESAASFWRKFYPTTDTTFLKWNDNISGEYPEEETRIDYHSPSNTEHREYVYLRTVNKGASEARYAVDVEFGAMSFTYSRAVWNVDTYEYEENDIGFWTGNTGENNRITVSNYSNKSIQFSAYAEIEFIYRPTSEDSINGISVYLTHDDKAYTMNTPVTVPAASEATEQSPGAPSSDSLRLMLSGVPQMALDSYATVGMVSVLISKTS